MTYEWTGPSVLSADAEHERNRVQAAIAEHQQLLQQQEELRRLRAQVERNIGQEPTAEHIRQTAFIRNGDSPETCRARLRAVAQEASTWKRRR